MDVQIYQCFHDHGSFPKEKYINDVRPALLCGSSATHRTTDDITGCLRDDAGDNISRENPQYSELTGYYWVWKNRPSEYVGIEHYRRHFLSESVTSINDEVRTEDLLTADEIKSILKDYDIIIPVHESLWNTSIFDLYEICFSDQAKDIVHWMNKFFSLEGSNYVYKSEMHNYLANNILIRGNMLITKWDTYCDYCKNMFSMIDYFKDNMKVAPESRVWGYVTELFPMIYIKTNGLKYKEVNVSVDDFNCETNTATVHTTLNNGPAEFNKDPQIQIRYLSTL